MRDRGFEHFGFCGFLGEPWAAERRAGFVDCVQPVFMHETRWRGKGVLPWAQEQKLLSRWLKSLPHPVGIFACNDVRARHVLESCRRLGLSVPERVAVLGVDNDELLCQMCDPPLSSVLPDAFGLGFSSANLLDRMMSGRRTSAGTIQLAPRNVVTRQSTDTLAVADADVAAALRFIRENACRGICVADVLRQVPLSRSLLDARFRASVDRSPHAEIRSVQLQKAAQLLRESDLSLKQISAAAGFTRMEYLSYLFKRRYGKSPRQYRKS